MLRKAGRELAVAGFDGLAKVLEQKGFGQVRGPRAGQVGAGVHVKLDRDAVGVGHDSDFLRFNYAAT